MRRAIVLFVVLVFAAACAHLIPARSSAACEPTKIAPSWLTAGPVYRDCEVDSKATVIEPQAKPKWVPTSTVTRCNVSLVEFVVDTNGNPEPKSARAVRATDPGLSVVHLKSVPSNRYVPALKDGHRVRQVVRDGVVFFGQSKMAPNEFGYGPDTACHP